MGIIQQRRSNSDNQSREVGNRQELKQSSTLLDPEHQMGKLQKHKETQHTREARG